MEIVVEYLWPKAIVLAGMGVPRQSGLTTREHEESSLFGVPAIRVRHTAAHGQTREICVARGAAIRKMAGL